MQERIYSIDYLRVLLAAFVVIGHAGLGRESFGVAGLIVLNTVLRLAVPLFAMTAGFFLFRTRLRGRYWLWVRRMAMIYLVWYAIYFVFMGLWDQSLRQSLRELVLGFRHLWFLEGLVLGAAMMHFAIPRGPRFMLATGVVAGLLGLAMEYPAVAHLVPIPLELFRSGPFFLYPFMVMGYLFAMQRDDAASVPWRIPARGRLIAVALAGLVIAMVENTVFLTMVSKYALLEVQVGMYLMAPMIFALALGMSAPATDLPLGTIASAVYVIHYLVLHFANQLQPDHPLGPALAAFFLPALLVLAMTRLGRGQRWMAQLF
ncbi:acyltransferase family protein [Paracoccus spongiarum]|uniref:Acyltransferase n=1 Tax=Paracoccus spongiarum TaxID=3064387 RepID=A0ABT9JE40_9RHOB|nr:acyltransferase [Paracoccus sp. 2205BS29-5]MDP5308091.1 acyltransferase [Paracoccus sp. 2205BS29-5]